MAILSVRVVNVGRRPVSVTHVSLMLPKGQDSSYLLCTDPFTARYRVIRCGGRSSGGSLWPAQVSSQRLRSAITCGAGSGWNLDRIRAQEYL